MATEMPTYSGPLKPGDEEILERARAWEAEHPEAEGWRWFEVRALPTDLVRLVIRGKIQIVRRRKPPKDPAYYRLVVG